MKKIYLFLTAASAVFFLAGTIYAQNTGEIEWLAQIDKKPAVTYNDAVNLFVYQTGKNPSTFEQDSTALASEGIALQGYNGDTPLTKGMLSKMTAGYLKLEGSLMYNFFKTERYAFKACIANGIFKEDGSQYDRLSGPAMIEVFSKINEIRGEQK